MAKVFIVEDDQGIRERVASSLSGRGHEVQAAATAMDGLSAIVAWSPDVVILDLGLPDLDGGDLLNMLRAVSDVSVVIATARDDEPEIVRLLDAGADDYVVKPYSADQLEARIRAVLRRGPGTGPAQDRRAPLSVQHLRVDPASRVAELDGAVLELTPMEFDLLEFLMSRVGTVVSKRELLAEVWRQPYGGSEKTVDVHLSWLRRKLGESAAEPRFLQTVHGVGIKLVEPPT